TQAATISPALAPWTGKTPVPGNDLVRFSCTIIGTWRTRSAQAIPKCLILRRYCAVLWHALRTGALLAVDPDETRQAVKSHVVRTQGQKTHRHPAQACGDLEVRHLQLLFDGLLHRTWP